LLDRLISTGIEPLTAEMLEQYLGRANSEKIYNLIGKIGDSDAAGTLAAVEDLINSGISEVQVVDSLVDYMRDLMVVKYTSADSEFLALTSEQRKRTGELAEKFDTAGLIYNITALEKLRWTLKNSDTPRALLDALMLRFALSEHFLNVDELMSQLQGRSAPAVKKKELTAAKTETREEGRGKTEDRGRTTDDGRRTTDDRRQKADDRAGVNNERRGKTTSQKRNEIISDPAVKTILFGLDATITGIEEN